MDQVLNNNIATLDDGSKCWCTDVPGPLEEILMIDNIGRLKVVGGVPNNATLVMIPINGFGAIPFDLLIQNVDGMVGVAMDENKRRVFVQRPPQARSEIFDIATEAAKKNQSSIIVPQFGVPTGSVRVR